MNKDTVQRGRPFRKVLSLLMAASMVGSALLGASPALAAEIGGPEQAASGNTVYFGTYPKTKNDWKPPRGNAVWPNSGVPYVIEENEKDKSTVLSKDTVYLVEPLEWEVLASDSSGITLITKDNVEAMPFSATGDSAKDWAASSIRNYLNGTFLTAKPSIGVASNIEGSPSSDSLFSDAEQEAISGEVSILSYGELLSYYPSASSRLAVDTDYTSRRTDTSDAGKNDYWWLRTPGRYDISGPGNGSALYVDETTGNVNEDGFETGRNLPIRPVVHLSKDSVLMVSEASAAKPSGALSAVSFSASAPLKLTLVDGSLTKPDVPTDAVGVNTVSSTSFSLAYTDSPTGTIGALLEQDGVVKYYGQPTLAGGQLTFDVSGVAKGAYTLKVFDEVRGDAYHSDYASAPAEIALTVADATMTISTTNLPDGFAGEEYSFQVRAASVPAPTKYTASDLPSGLTMDANTGVISGRPTAEGTANVTITVTNGTATNAVTLPLIVKQKPFITTDGTLPGGKQKEAYTTTIDFGGTPTVTIWVTNGALPSGLSLNSTTGVISGDPTVGGTFTFDLTAQSPIGTATKTFTLYLEPTSEATITTVQGEVTDATEGQNYTFEFQASGHPTPDITLYSGSLPGNMTGDGSVKGKFTVSGAPTATGTFTFDLKAANAGSFDIQEFTITVNEDSGPTGTAPSFQTTTLPKGVVGEAYNETITLNGSPAPTLSFSSGMLPSGLTLSGNTISGTPLTAGGPYSFVLEANNGVAPNATQSFTITIDEAGTPGPGPDPGPGTDPSNPSPTDYPTVSPGSMNLQIGSNATGYIQVTLGNSDNGIRADRAELSGNFHASIISDYSLTDNGIVTVTAVRQGTTIITVHFYDDSGAEMTAYTQTVSVTVTGASGGSSGGGSGSSGGSSGGGGGGGGGASAGGNQLDGTGYPSTSSQSTTRFAGDNSPAVENSLWDNFMKRIPTDVPKAVSAGQKNASIRIQNANSLTAERAASIVSSAQRYGGGVRVLADNVVDKHVTVRLTLAPELVTKEIKLYASLDNAFTTSTKNLFGRTYSNNIRVIYFAQEGDIGQKAAIAAKADLTGMNTTNLYFYSYDRAANSISAIAQPNYWVDSNGYLRFETSVLVTIIISDGPLARK